MARNGGSETETRQTAGEMFTGDDRVKTFLAGDPSSGKVDLRIKATFTPLTTDAAGSVGDDEKGLFFRCLRRDGASGVSDSRMTTAKAFFKKAVQLEIENGVQLSTLRTIPPLHLLLRLLGTDVSSMLGAAKVRVNSGILLQLIALAKLSEGKSRGSLSENDAESLLRYFSNALPESYTVDEEFYLERNPDVAAAVMSNQVQSGSSHFLSYGVKDGRAPNSDLLDTFISWASGDILDWEVPLAIEEEDYPEVGRQIRKLSKLNKVAFIQALEETQYWNGPLRRPGRPAFVADLHKLAAVVRDRERISIFSWLLANHDHSDAEEMWPLLKGAMENDRILPSLAKAVDGYFIDTGRLAGERRLLLDLVSRSAAFSSFRSGDVDVFEDAIVRFHASELDARYYSGSLTSLPKSETDSRQQKNGRHLFVGFFGQLRFPDETMPKISMALRSEFPNAKISFAVSTWDLSGVRELEDEHRVHFATEQLPAEFLTFCTDKEIADVQQFSHFFPEVTRMLRARGRGAQEVSGALLNSLCGAPVYSRIDNDAVFMTTTGAVLSQAYKDRNIMLNQGRMWNRISRFDGLINDVERECGPVTDVVLIRSDLMLNGSLSAALGSAPDGFLEKGVLVDYDAHAKYINGIGDRIFISGREAAQRLFDAERVMTKTLMDGGTARDIHYWFLAPHVYPQTLLYQHGSNISCLDQEIFSVEIYRGRMSWEQILPQAVSDSLNSQNAAARDFLSSSIGAHHRLSERVGI